MSPIALCSRIRLSWPISENDGVYAFVRSARSAGCAQQLAAVEAALRIDAALVVGERRELLVGQELELGDADAVLAGDDAVQRARERHDARDRGVRLLQHPVIVGIDRNVRVHVAVARVHVQRDEHAAAQHFAVDRVAAREQRRERAAGEDRARAAP